MRTRYWNIVALVAGLTVAPLAQAQTLGGFGGGGFVGGSFGGAAFGGFHGGRRGPQIGVVVGGVGANFGGVQQRSPWRWVEQAAREQAFRERQQWEHEQQRREQERSQQQDRIRAQEAARAEEAARVRALAQGQAEASAVYREELILVVETQKSLVRMGYDPGSIDGRLSPETETAIKSYQADQSLIETGQISDALLNHMLQHGG